jgi:hypothetical protein
MSSLSEIQSAVVAKVLGNRCQGKAVLAINAASAATVKTTNAITYTVNGVALTKTALAAQSMVPTHDAYGDPVAVGILAYVQPASTTVYYVISLNAAGTVAISQGSYAGQTQVYPTNLSKTAIGNGVVPVEPTGYTGVGIVKVVTGATTFTPGTTALDAALVTATYFDVDVLPVAP